jgi:cytochrome c556
VIFAETGILLLKGGESMRLKSLAITMGLGAAAGAVAIMMMPKSNPTRRLAAKAAAKVEDAACKVTDKLTNRMEM